MLQNAGLELDQLNTIHVWPLLFVVKWAHMTLYELIQLHISIIYAIQCNIVIVSFVTTRYVMQRRCNCDKHLLHLSALPGNEHKVFQILNQLKTTFCTAITVQVMKIVEIFFRKEQIDAEMRSYQMVLIIMRMLEARRSTIQECCVWCYE